jgi:hypothetical protein
LTGKAKARGASVLVSRYAPPPLQPIGLREPAGIEAVKLFLENLRQNWLPNYVMRIQKETSHVLTAAGLPDNPGAMLVVEEESRRVVVGKEKKKVLADLASNPRDVSLHRGLAKIAQLEGCETGSKVWYAAKVLDQIACFDHAMKEGDRDAIAHEAFHLGALVKQADVDVELGRALDAGYKNLNSLSAAAQAANAKRSASATAEHRRWMAAAREIWLEKPQLKISDCARRVKQRLGLKKSVRTIRFVIAVEIPKKVGKAG